LSACGIAENGRKLRAMDDLGVTIRRAKPDDAADIARVYIESWHDTYPGVISTTLLRSMTLRGQTARWRTAVAVRNRETIFVAEAAEHGIVAMSSFGPSRDPDLGYDAEVYTLYVDPGYLGRGVGRTLLSAAFHQLHENGYQSCIIWAHARNTARFFYERMGGRLAAERTARMMGDPVPEAAFGWKSLTAAERSTAR
jgi:ribosomal protein S18 acetylase RimI-like enzyme